jgi:CheY-like chemotaxis protein
VNVSQEIVLVVKDDVLIRIPIAQYLRDCGYRVIEAACADEAMAVLLHEEKMLM